MKPAFLKDLKLEDTWLAVLFQSDWSKEFGDIENSCCDTCNQLRSYGKSIRSLRATDSENWIYEFWICYCLPDIYPPIPTRTGRRYWRKYWQRGLAFHTTRLVGVPTESLRNVQLSYCGQEKCFYPEEKAIVQVKKYKMPASWSADHFLFLTTNGSNRISWLWSSGIQLNLRVDSLTQTTKL